MSILTPVSRGLIGWYDARAYWQISGTPLPEIADLSGNLHNMKHPDTGELPNQPMDVQGESSLFLRQVKNNVFGDWPAFVGDPKATFGQGYYCARRRIAQTPDPEATICCLVIPPTFAHNSNAPVSFGYFNTDSYYAPLASALNQWTGPFALHPWGKAPIGFSQPTRIILAGDLVTEYFRQDGVLYEEVPTVHPNGFGFWFLEMGRGNPFSPVGIALFYNVKLTPEECQQNEQFMDWTTSESLPYAFQQKNPLP